MIKIALLVLIAFGVINVATKMWRAFRHSAKERDDIDERVDREINEQSHWYPLSIVGWLLFIFEGSANGVIAVGLVLSVFAVMVYQQDHDFILKSVPVKAVYVDTSDSSSIEFKTLDGRQIQTRVEYPRLPSKNTIDIRYSIENPSKVEASSNFYGGTYVLTALGVFSLALGIYRRYLFRPKPPIRDWRSEI